MTERWNTNQLELVIPEGFDGNAASLKLPDGRCYRLDLAAMRQIADFVGLPWRYSCRMMEEAPELLCANVNHWFRDLTRDRAIRIEAGRLTGFLPLKDPHD